MDAGTYQLSKTILVDLGAPPAIAGIFRLMVRGWVAAIEPGGMDTLTKQKLKIEFRIVLVLLYLVVLGESLYRLLT